MVAIIRNWAMMWIGEEDEEDAPEEIPFVDDGFIMQRLHMW
jgi:hypothetical protein